MVAPAVLFALCGSTVATPGGGSLAAAAPAFLTKNRPFRCGQPVFLFHQPVEHVMLGVGELGSTLYYKTGANQVNGVYECCPDDLVTLHNLSNLFCCCVEGKRVL